MGSNMQRQAVPLLVPEPPLVSHRAGKGSRQALRHARPAQEDGTVVYVDAERIKLEEKDKIVREYVLRKYHGLNERTCLNQKPIVAMGDKVKKGQIIADGAATRDGELALGRNVLVAFMSWEGTTSRTRSSSSRAAGEERHVHLDPHRGVRHRDPRDEARQGRVHPRHSERRRRRRCRTSTSMALSRSARSSAPATSSSARCRPKCRSELTPEEKLLHAIFGRAGEDVKNDSLEVPSGVEGIVIAAHRFSRRASMTEDEKKELARQEKEINETYSEKIADQFREFVEALEDVLDKKELKDPNTGKQLRQRQGRQDRRRAGQGASSSRTSTSAARRTRRRPRRFTTATGSGSSSSSTSRSAS